MENKQKIIFSNSYSPRTGHNFASEVIKIFSGHEVLAHNRSETKLSNLLYNYFEISNSVYYKSDRDFFDKIILQHIREAILNESENKFVMIKNTSFEGVYALPKVFPNDIHILLIRNPIDVFNSVFKAMNLNKRGFKYKLKKIGKLCGLYPYYLCRKISVKTIKHIPDFENFYVIKYEDLVNQNEEVLRSLKQKFNSPKPLEKIKNEIDSIKVINTSFYEEIGSKNIWDAKDRTKEFNPINRKTNSFVIRKGIEIGAKKLAKKLGYL